MDQTLGKLVQTYGESDRASATALLADSARMLEEAEATSRKAARALDIPWSMQ